MRKLLITLLILITAQSKIIKADEVVNAIDLKEKSKLIKKFKEENLYDFSSRKFDIKKKMFTNLIDSIDPYDTKLLENLKKVKNDLLIISIFFDNKKGTLMALDLGAQINSNYDISPLNIAIINNNFELCKILVDNGVKLNDVDKTGLVPLFWTIYVNELEFFHFLVKNGSDISIVLENGKTPVQAAIETENIQFLESLLQNKAYMTDLLKKNIKKIKNKKIRNILKRYKLL